MEVSARPINGFPDYVVCSDGRIMNRRLNHVIKPFVRPGKSRDLETVTLRKDGRTHCRGAEKLRREAYPELFDE